MTRGFVAGDHPAGDARAERYRPGVPTDGGVWRGPTAEAWVTRLLRGAPAPRRSTGLGHEAGAAQVDVATTLQV